MTSMRRSCRILLCGFAALIVSAQAAPKTTLTEARCKLCLYGPDNMVFDAAGNMYLVDTDHKTHSRVLKISPEGEPLAEWHVFSVSRSHKNGPEGIAIDHDGNILVTDAGSMHVLKLSPTGKLLSTLGRVSQEFHDLGHVAIDPQGNIYVAEAKPNLIHKFSPTGEHIATWHRDQGVGPEQWNGPESIAVQSNGNLAVEDWGNHRIEILSLTGDRILQFGGAGREPGEFASSSGLCTDHVGNTYVADYELRRVQEFDFHGRLLTTIGNSDGNTVFEQGPGAIAVDNHGDLYAPDGLSIVKFSREGKLLARWH